MKLLLFTLLFPISIFSQTTYYISSSGNDANNGTSPSTPWKTVQRMSNCSDTYLYTPVYSPGDSILFKRGDTFYGQIEICAVGTQSQPIVIGAYGTGARPIINGELPTDTWTPTSGQTGIYQTYTGNHTVMSNYYNFQWVDGEWVMLDGIYIRGANPGDWPSFYSSLTQGRFGRSSDRDTLFVHTIGNVTMPTTRDSIRMNRNGGGIGSGSGTHSEWVIVRDIEFYRGNGAIEVSYGHNIILRNLSTKKTLLTALAFDNVTEGLIDSCVSDSGGNTQLYLKACIRSICRHDTVKNILELVDGIAVEGDKAGIGIQGNYGSGLPWAEGYGYNTIEYNVCDAASPIDFWYNIGDTIRYNTMINCGAIYPHGTNIYVNGNMMTQSTAGGFMHGMNLGNGTITVTDNMFIGTNDSWVWLENDSGATGGQYIFTNNVVKLGTNENAQFMTVSDSGITVTNNAYIGLGNWGSYKSGDHYHTLAEWQAATGFDSGSTYGDYFIRPIIWGTGTSSPSSPKALASGATQRYTVATGTLTWMKADSVAVDSTAGYTFSNISRDHTIEFNFLEEEEPPPTPRSHYLRRK